MSSLLLAATNSSQFAGLDNSRKNRKPDERQSFVFALIPLDDDEFEAVEHVDKYEAETDEDGNERDEESDGVEESSSLSPCTELSADE